MHGGTTYRWLSDIHFLLPFSKSPPGLGKHTIPQLRLYDELFYSASCDHATRYWAMGC